MSHLGVVPVGYFDGHGRRQRRRYRSYTTSEETGGLEHITIFNSTTTEQLDTESVVS